MDPFPYWFEIGIPILISILLQWDSGQELGYARFPCKSFWLCVGFQIDCSLLYLTDYCYLCNCCSCCLNWSRDSFQVTVSPRAHLSSTSAHIRLAMVLWIFHLYIIKLFVLTELLCTVFYSNNVASVIFRKVFNLHHDCYRLLCEIFPSKGKHLLLLSTPDAIFFRTLSTSSWQPVFLFCFCFFCTYFIIVFEYFFPYQF